MTDSGAMRRRRSAGLDGRSAPSSARRQVSLKTLGTLAASPCFLSHSFPSWPTSPKPAPGASGAMRISRESATAAWRCLTACR